MSSNEYSIVDEKKLRKKANEIGKKSSGGKADDARQELVALLKKTMADGRAAAEKQLRKDGLGTACAVRLSDLQDVLIQVTYDYAVTYVYPVENPSSAERMAVVATGGYGRGLLAPGSDVDLLFLLPYKQTPWGESVVEYILYILWDLNLKVGHATRSIPDCIRLSRADMTIRTAILEARYLWGDKALFEELVAKFDNEVMKGTGPEFIAAKLAERDERHRAQGASRYLVEPNVKEGKGGLRDLHTLFWIAKYFYRVSSNDELVKAGVFSRAELNRLRKAEDFLWSVRCHLHFLDNRAEERLSFDVQREMATRLGYTTHPGLKDVERFMKHYFLVAKDVGDLTRIFCAALEEHHGKPAPALNRFLRLKRPRKRKLAGTTDFVVENNRIHIAEEDVFERDPINLLRVFHHADKSSLAFHPDALQAVTRGLKLIDVTMRESEEANRLFIEILTSRRNPEIVLRAMNETGVLGRFIPDFGKVVAMMQFSMYHHYTVDEHLLRTIGYLSEIDRGEMGDAHPLANDLVPTLKDRTVLYVAMFLHDIAKGRPEDHSIAGARIARRLCPRLGLNASQTEAVAWLVEHHLVMSMTAQSRDLQDRKTIMDFAAVVQNLERLKMLLILTVADIKGVGPGVWNGWKGQLLRTLYYETEPVLTGGYSQVSRDKRVAAAQAELEEALPEWSKRERTAYIKQHYPAYWLRVDLPHKIAHAELIKKASEAKQTLTTSVRTLAFQAVTEITIYAPDHPRLLSVLAGACAVAGANIVDAQIHTTKKGQALDTIFISREFDQDDDEERRAGRVSKLIEGALAGTAELPEQIKRKSQPKGRLKAFALETAITIDNDLSNVYTVIEASGLDRPGLLYGLTTAISDLNLNIASAHISTFGERAVDVFYVTDLTGLQVTNANRQAAIRRRLTSVFDPAQGAAKETKAAKRREPA